MECNKVDLEDVETNVAPDIPEWLNSVLVQKALDAVACKGSEASVKVEDVVIEEKPEGVAQHYLSEVFRLRANVTHGGESSESERRIVHLVAKTPPRSPIARDTVERAGFFRAERWALAQVLPRIDRAVRAAATEASSQDKTQRVSEATDLFLELGEEEKEWHWEPLWANCLLEGNIPDEFILMEDLSAEGFRVVEAARGLGLRHCLLALRALARFHAASRLLVEGDVDDQEVLRMLGNPCGRSEEAFEERIADELRVAGREIAEWPGIPERLGERVAALGTGAWARFSEANAPRPGAFNVLVHGDYWANNLLFRYDAHGRPCAVRAVDWQVAHVASPAIDLLYFFYTSLSEHTWDYYWDMLLREYHASLNEALVSFGCTRLLPMEELRAQMGRTQSGSWAVFACVHILPLVKSPGCVYTSGADPSSQAHIYRTAAYQRAMRRALQRLLREGLLEP